VWKPRAICAAGLSLAVMQQFGRSRSKSRHHADTMKVSRLTQLRHWLYTAAMDLMPISAPIEELVSTAKMPSLELGGQHAATRVHHAPRRCSGDVAA
jgi:hypothetical protein